MNTTRANPKPKQNHMLYMQFRKQAVIITEQNWGGQLQNLYVCVCVCDWRAGMHTHGCMSERKWQQLTEEKQSGKASRAYKICREKWREKSKSQARN